MSALKVKVPLALREEDWMLTAQAGVVGTEVVEHSSTTRHVPTISPPHGATAPHVPLAPPEPLPQPTKDDQKHTDPLRHRTLPLYPPTVTQRVCR